MAGKKKQTEAAQPSAKKSAGATVLVEFRDLKDFTKIHNVGDDVSHFDSERIEKLIALGYVEGKSEPTIPTAPADSGNEGGDSGNSGGDNSGEDE